MPCAGLCPPHGISLIRRPLRTRYGIHLQKSRYGTLGSRAGIFRQKAVVRPEVSGSGVFYSFIVFI